MLLFEDRIKGYSYNEKYVQKLIDGLRIDKIVAKLLVKRNVLEVDEAKKFLSPKLAHLFDPFLFKDMAKVVGRINRAIKNNEKITLYGDYDVDGITSIAILYSYLSKFIEVDVYIPSRQKEGYGLNSKAVELLGEKGAKLLIALDCGITAINEVEKANEFGIDVIIADHHLCGELKPNAFALLVTTDVGETYPFKSLCSAGIAAKIVQALGGEAALEEILDLVAVGTVADMVPLIAENRVFVSLGLEKIKEKASLGIEALLNIAGIELKMADATKIAFQIAPRINAAGRVGNARFAFDLLVCDRKDSAKEIAAILNENNNIRQQVEQKLIKEVYDKIFVEHNLSTERILVINGEGWHKGVIGIAASKVVEQFVRPCLLISVNEDRAIGSARSVGQFDIFKALSSFKHLFDKLGGHSKAAGFSLPAKNIPILKESLLEYTYSNLSEDMLVKRVYYDEELQLADITPKLVEDLKRMEPFGMANHSPVFLISGLEILDGKTVGNASQHLKLTLKKERKVLDGIGFGLTSHLSGGSIEGNVDLVTGIGTNEWMGVTKVQLQIKAINQIIENKNDINKILKSYYFKFFDAFFSELKYNENGFSSYCSRANQNKPNSVDFTEISRNLKSVFMGVLILVNSLEGAQWILNNLLEAEDINSLNICYHEPTNLPSNTLVLAPKLRDIPLCQYSKIYYLEEEEGCFPDYFFLRVKTESLYKLKSLELNTLKDKPIFESLKVDRTFLEDFYVWMKKEKKGKGTWKDFPEVSQDFDKSSKLGYNGFQILTAIGIFQELGFISVKTENGFLRIDCDNSPSKRELSESKLYLRYKDYFDILVNK